MCVVLVDLYLAKMNDSTTILARFVICTDCADCACRVVLCKSERQYSDFGKICDLQSCALRVVLAKSEGSMGESKSFCKLRGLAGGRRPEIFAGCP